METAVKQARVFFDSWLDQFPTWADFVQAGESSGLPEFEGSREDAVKQVTDWLGGAAEAWLLISRWALSS